ncbi:MAG TPA: hypothetical protein VHT53_02680 [Candidatus Elarobacter sp.]|jgi:hypothetical protein|nr:hypothetical protein [Candidatus Elarobacter sp.]
MDGEAGDDRARRESLARAFLAYVLVPAWVIPAVADWAFHRRTHIERNAGAAESITHLAMNAEAGVGIVASTVFEIDAGVIAVMIAAALAHEATAVLDVAYAKSRRYVAQAEQHTYSFLEVLPFVNAALAAFAQPRQALALLGLGGEAPRFAFRVRRPIPLRTTIVCGACGVLGMGPYVEEFIRCVRARPRGRP